MGAPAVAISTPVGRGPAWLRAGGSGLDPGPSGHRRGSVERLKSSGVVPNTDWGYTLVAMTSPFKQKARPDEVVR